MPEPSLSKSRRRGSRNKGDVEKGRLRVHDPFELIRWLALSQPDPRKALAELVQNSLDAGARHIRITRARENHRPCLRIMDDGEGVIPEMNRSEALKYIATHIGHSRKRSLSPQQRLELMTQGQYGIGLLGFWSLGEMLEMRTSLPGQEPYRLVLKRDLPEFEIGKLHGRLAFDERWTEVVVTGLNHEAMTALAARRAADYLASELRGQLLARDVNLVMEDKMARGRAPKFIAVKPPRFLGERLEGLGPVQIPGHPPIRMEIYLLGEETEDSEPRGLGLYAAGTMAAERFEDLAALALDHPPWTDRRLTGLVDFPGLQVAPGSRRGIVPNESAAAFVEALIGVEPLLNKILEARERERAEKLDKNLIRDLQRAFRDFYRHRPRYSMLPTRSENDADAGPGETQPDGGQKGGDEPVTPSGLKDTLPESPPPQEELFPPGPLKHVEIIPSRLRVECGVTRSVRAKATDAAGRPLRAPKESVQFSWELWGQIGSLSEVQGEPDQIFFIASEKPAEGILSVLAKSGNLQASAAVPVEVSVSLPAGPSDEGIPEPELVDHPGAPWRSRLFDGRWQVNSGHPDFKANSKRPTLKLRYLSLLFAKEVVLRSSQDPRLESPLEQVVEVAAFADRKITDRQSRRRRPPKKDEGDR